MWETWTEFPAFRLLGIEPVDGRSLFLSNKQTKTNKKIPIPIYCFKNIIQGHVIKNLIIPVFGEDMSQAWLKYTAHERMSCL